MRSHEVKGIPMALPRVRPRTDAATRRRSAVPPEKHLRALVSVLSLLCVAADPIQAQTESRPLRVFATAPDLGSLVREVGGDQVEVSVIAKGREDAHFVEAKPSFIKWLSEADLYLQVGFDLEIGYAPLLLQNARNAKVLPGSLGYLDASTAIAPLDVPSAPVDRSMGDVHPLGNPHYLLDPVNGLKVARLIRERLGELRPDQKGYFGTRYDAFQQRLCAAMVGDALAKKYDAQKLAVLFAHGKLDDFLRQQGDAAALGGWFAILQEHHGAQAVDDHNLWPYFARRFGLDVIGHMEPKPGIPPTTTHLTRLIEQMRTRQVKLIIAAPYYDPRHARFVAEATGARVVYLSHQVDSREGTGDYIRMLDYNVRQLAGALAS